MIKDHPSHAGKRRHSRLEPADRRLRVLYVTSELFPLAKVGGLADVSAALPVALKALGHDVRILVPAYACVKERARSLKSGPVIELPGIEAPAALWLTTLEDSEVPVYLLDAPALFDRAGGPYADAQGDEWPDNPTRFLALAVAALEIAEGRSRLHWRPQLLHGNDWPSGYLHALAAASRRIPTVFTVHNMAHHGLAPFQLLDRHGLPKALASTAAMEFYGQLSALKGGLVFADQVTTVSPGYAQEIQTPVFGCGLEGVVRQRAARVSGILNGVDYDLWDPRVDQYIVANYDRHTVHRKEYTKACLQRHLGLPQDASAPLAAFIGRLTHQKGIDLILPLLGRLAERAQIAVLGAGDQHFQWELTNAAMAHESVAVSFDHDERLAHLIEAGADMLLMPSRYEPCGLNQMYSLRYGTIPIVHFVGGLRDTVTDADEDALVSGNANGFVFRAPLPDSLQLAVDRALDCYRDPFVWRQLQWTGMVQDFSWQRSARAYAEVYRSALRCRSATLDAGAGIVRL
jgi:starch synthase